MCRASGMFCFTLPPARLMSINSLDKLRLPTMLLCSPWPPSPGLGVPVCLPACLPAYRWLYQTTKSWNKVYARTDVTAAEVVELVSNLGPAEVSQSKMCISLLSTPSGGTVADSHGTAGRRRGVGSLMEAVQIAGPSGVFQEWKVRA